jgi:hypothetical protein
MGQVGNYEIEIEIDDGNDQREVLSAMRHCAEKSGVCHS